MVGRRKMGSGMGACPSFITCRMKEEFLDAEYVSWLAISGHNTNIIGIIYGRSPSVST